MERRYTYCHEHLHIDLSRVKKDQDTILDEREKIIEELKNLYKKGVGRMVEVTNRGMGRDIDFIIDIEKQTNIEVVAGTGYYIDEFFPREVYDLEVEDLAKIMIDEITLGIGGSEKKAGLIGEIGTSYNTFTPLEKKVFLASSIAHKETGVPISTHTSLSTLGLEQVEFLKREKVDLNRVTIGHCDLREDLDTLLKLLDQGVYIQFDTIGKNSYYPDEKRVRTLVELSKRGYLERVMLSMDITRKSHLKENGGLGWAYLIDRFVPMLKEAGIKENQIETMLIDNPNRFFKEEK